MTKYVILSIFRPFLETPKSKILELSRIYNFKYFNDSSNDSIRFERNFIRNKLLPEIHERFPGYRGIFSLRKKEHLGMLKVQSTCKVSYYNYFSSLRISYEHL